MGVHKECGEPISWLKREGTDRYLPPMDMIGEVFIKNEDGEAVQKIAYAFHNCDPEKIIAWADYKHRLAEAKGISSEVSDGIDDYQAAKARDKQRAWDMSTKVVCPLCDALVGNKCHSLAQQHRKTGELVEIKNPHQPRINLAIEEGHWHEQD